MRIFSLFLAKLAEFWHFFISPWLPMACRHEPSCSQYMAQALREHGLFRGLRLGLGRIGRCQPWGTSGWDPVPGSPLKKGLS